MNGRSRNLLLAAGAIGLMGAVLASGGVAPWRRRNRLAREAADHQLPKAGIADTLATLLDVLVPTIAKGVTFRRPAMEAMAEKLELDRRAIRRLQKLRARYGSGPLMLRLPLRSQAVVLEPEHVHHVLNGTPEPFAAASSEKLAALSHFEPKGVLVSHGAERAERRRYNELALDSGNPVHRMAQYFLPVVEQEAAQILEAARKRGELTWEEFSEGWFRTVRRVIFGNSARGDNEISRVMAELRKAANWAFLRPGKTALREELFARINSYLQRGEPGTLAAMMADIHAGEEAVPHQQVPQWLFAFDPAGMATFRALALLSVHPEQEICVQEEIRSHPREERQELPLLRATVLESLRLWPTTPLVLRQTTRETQWENGAMPAGTGIAIFAPYFHRDDERRVYANQFTPELWLKERTSQNWPLIPFSGGPAICPGRNLVLLLTSAMLAALLDGRQLRLHPDSRLNPECLPGTLNHYSLRFLIVEQSSRAGAAGVPH